MTPTSTAKKVISSLLVYTIMVEAEVKVGMADGGRWTPLLFIMDFFGGVPQVASLEALFMC